MVFFSLADSRNTILVVKCVGPCLVMMGITLMLLRILFTYKPTCLVELGRKKKERKKKKKFRKENERKFEEDEFTMTNKCSNSTLKRVPQKQASQHSENEGSTFSIECTSEEARALENNIIEEARERRQKNKPKNEVVIKVSKLG